MGKVAPECFKLYIDHIATSCMHNKGKYRPVINEVELILEHALSKTSGVLTVEKCDELTENRNVIYPTLR